MITKAHIQDAALSPAGGGSATIISLSPPGVDKLTEQEKNLVASIVDIIVTKTLNEYEKIPGFLRSDLLPVNRNG